ncbi:hypothetical protein LTR36_002578 [Oleoguttula mirabilis]|uniref:Uncharacterized protein n=1 Tax=Oleoguttula mirabilis TaxID=1507867 RepID=A0AAV9JJM5_9PEZI|nr:hypothetical protein LTR36_002578 [Oleoguttula mirabilis]
MSSSNISRATHRTGATGVSHVSAANIAQLDYDGKRVQNRDQGPMTVESMLQYQAQATNAASYPDYGVQGSDDRYSSSQPAVTNNIYMSQRQGTRIGSRQGPPVSYHQTQSQSSRRPSVSSYVPQASRRPSVSGHSYAPSEIAPEPSRVSRRPSVSGDSRVASEYGAPQSSTSRRPSVVNGDHHRLDYGRETAYESRSHSVSGSQSQASRSEAPRSHAPRSHAPPPASYKAPHSSVSHAPSQSNVSYRSRSGSVSSKAVPPPPASEISQLTERTIRPTDSASNVTSVRNAPSSYAGSRAPSYAQGYTSSHAGSRAPSQAQGYTSSHAGSHAPSHAPSHTPSNRTHDGSTIVMPSRTTLSRSNSARPSKSRALGSVAQSSSPRVRETTESLPSDSRSGRVRIIRTEETTRITESIEIGSSSSGHSLRRHQGNADLHRPRPRPRRLSFDSDSDDSDNGDGPIDIYTEYPGLFDTGPLAPGGFLYNLR